MTEELIFVNTHILYVVGCHDCVCRRGGFVVVDNAAAVSQVESREVDVRVLQESFGNAFPDLSIWKAMTNQIRKLLLRCKG